MIFLCNCVKCASVPQPIEIVCIVYSINHSIQTIMPVFGLVSLVWLLHKYSAVHNLRFQPKLKKNYPKKKKNETKTCDATHIHTGTFFYMTRMRGIWSFDLFIWLVFVVHKKKTKKQNKTGWSLDYQKTRRENECEQCDDTSTSYEMKQKENTRFRVAFIRICQPTRKNTPNVCRKFMGKLLSTVFMSVENREIIRPFGVVSKKSIGAPNIRCNRMRWMLLAACIVPYAWHSAAIRNVTTVSV